MSVKCGGCDTYCADCIYPRFSALEAMADAFDKLDKEQEQ